MSNRHVGPLACSCGYFEEPWMHHVDCDLWLDQDFAFGTRYWDHAVGRLTEASYDAPGRTEQDWTEIIETNGTPLDPWEEAVQKLDSEIDEIAAEFANAKKNVGHPLVEIVKSVASTIMGTAPEPDLNDCCGQPWQQCKCPPADKVTQEDQMSEDGPPGFKCFCFNEATGTYCGPCGLKREKVTDPWKPTYQHEEWLKNPKGCTCKLPCKLTCWSSNAQRWTTTSDRWVYWNRMATGTYTYGSYTPKCRHYGEEVTFPDGTVVYASSMKNQKDPDKDLIPDLGIYMSGSWDPTSIAYHLGWTDFGLPKIPDSHVRYIVEQGVEWARDGQIIEVGCVGGHGRTGSVLALMAMECGVDDPEAAIKWVRENYCKEAIEGAKQEWYIRKYHAVINNLPIPDPPPPPAPKATTASTTKTSTVTNQVSANKNSLPHTSGGGVTDVPSPLVRQYLEAYGLTGMGYEDLLGL